MKTTGLSRGADRQGQGVCVREGRGMMVGRIMKAGTAGKVVKILALVMVLGVLGSCVSMKKFNSQRADAMRLEAELSSLRTRLDDAESRVEQLNADKIKLIADTIRLHNNGLDLREQYAKLIQDGSAEASRMLKQIEDNQLALAENSRRVAELEALLRSREEAINDIRRKVTAALTGFEGEGLTISVRGGNVYVSMDDKLLFRSGSFEIDPNGARAVRDLSNVLAQNSDINVMVEGHTDDVAYRPNGNLRDNLDLSVKRATTVTRLLLENKGIDPARIISAGRGEYLPVDSEKTTVARAKNRRTEIILTPKLDELMQLMDSGN